uniref:Tubulin-tyrosine ligase n=1 Tax=Setaria digitata TaxID=48799 RepID=A0A915Q6C7_9BILA
MVCFEIRNGYTTRPSLYIFSKFLLNDRVSQHHLPERNTVDLTRRRLNTGQYLDSRSSHGKLYRLEILPNFTGRALLLNHFGWFYTMSCSVSSAASSCGEQQPVKPAALDEEKDNDICSLSCLVTNCLCTTSCIGDFSPPAMKPFLRPSLFPNVPPTIRFYGKGSKVTKPSKAIRSTLMWCKNSLLPIVMRQSLAASHFTIVDESNFWIGYWGRHLKSAQYRTIKPYQKVNHFPGAFHMGRKDRLWQHINEMITLWGFDEYHIMPTTYILPRDIKKLKTYLHGNPRHVVILKPPASARGTGISIASKIKQIPKKTPLVAQHYIDRPLIINSAKFDLRLYVYLTSLDPLRIYLYNDGLVRFASIPYSSAPSSMSNKFMHLTNYSINKLAHVAGERTTPVPKWKLSDFWSHVAEHVDVNVIKPKITDVIIKAVLACESYIRVHQKKHSFYTFTSHELYGMDILLDDTLRPWLLEVNISPSLHCSTPTDVAVKTTLAKDVLNLCGIQIPPDMTDKSSTLAMDYRVKSFDGNKNEEDLKKERYHLEYFKKNGKIDRRILDELTGYDARILIDFEDELDRSGNFDLIFPTAETIDYVKYYNSPLTYSNLLLAQWQMEQGNRGREVGISILEDISSKSEHFAGTNILEMPT